MPRRASLPVATSRFEKKRDAIVAAAAEQINHHGLHGMTLTAVAAEVGLITNSVTYYFKKKEDLAVACYLEGIERYKTLLTTALAAADPPRRVRRFIDLCVETALKIRAGEEPPLPNFSDIRALPEARRKVVDDAYGELFARARDLFRGPSYEWIGSHGRTVRALLLLENIYWWVGWLDDYDDEDLVRVAARTFDILAHGVGADNALWAPSALAFPEPDLNDKQDRAREAYLRVATRLLNREGYRGVSVKNISGELNLTKGAFYHHHDTKNEVIVACFERTFETVRRLQHAGAQMPSSWDALCATAATLVDFQFSEGGPLLRFSALMALPEDIRKEMFDQSDRVSKRFASMISDGLAEGGMRAVDPTIASQMINAALNASAELGFWVSDVDPSRAARLFARPMLMGFFRS